MRKLSLATFVAVLTLCAAPLRAQQVCPGLPYVANTPEDELMQEVNGAETPQEQIAALDKFTKEHADSRFMPCVHEYYTMAYLKLNQYDQVIEHGEKGLSGDYRDVMLTENVTKGYIASGKVSDTVFDIIMKGPEAIKNETNPPRPPNVKDEEWQKALEEYAEQGKEQRAYMEYAFLQLLPRVTDAGKRIQFLDGFVQAYPDSPNAGRINLQYFFSYQMANNAAKVAEYGEKTVAADPTDVLALNLVADDYATRGTNLDKAGEYAKRALDLAPDMKKPEGMSDDQFKLVRNEHLGRAHLTLGSVAFQRGSKTKKMAAAIQEFKAAADLLEGNPNLQARALFYTGYACEVNYPANHKEAIEALTRASSIPSPLQAQAQDLLAKVKSAAKVP